MKMLLRDIRKKIVEIGLSVFELGLVHDLQGNISIFDIKTGYIAVTPSGISYNKRCPQDICIIDLQNNLIEGTRRPTSELALHTSLYRNRSDIKAIIHTHPIHACVFAVAHQPIPQVLSSEGLGFKGVVPVAEYAKPGTQAVADLVCKTIGKDGKTCLLANHGLVTAGDNIDDAFNLTLSVDDTAQIIIMTHSMGAEVHLL